jgi:hypothetical protein
VTQARRRAVAELLRPSTKIIPASPQVANAQPPVRQPYVDVTKITVDGHPCDADDHDRGAWARRVLRRFSWLPNIGADQGQGCFGIQPDLLLRLAVIPIDKTTLLIWASTSKASPDEAFFAMFEKMLKSVRFR